MNILIVGASGLVGGNCQQYLQSLGRYNVLGTHLGFTTSESVYFNACDLHDIQNAVFDDFSPEVIVHCGALTHVDYCEENPEESFKRTVASTQNLLQIAQKHNSLFVYISTDYVFDGKRGPYKENEPVNPICVYGAHKLAAEQLVVESGLNFLILRITNVYGDEIRGKNFVSRLINQIKNNQDISLLLPCDQYATPINAYDIARCLVLLIENSKQGIYHLGSTDYFNRYQLASRIISRFSYPRADLRFVTTATLAQAAPRPLYGGLLAHKFLSEFPEFQFSSIDEYLTFNANA